MLSQWLRKCIHHTFHGQCDLCRLPIQSLNQTCWCHFCQDLMQELHQCKRCGLPVVTSTNQCGHCLSSPPLWSQLYCVGQYCPPLSTYIHKLKHGKQFWQAKSLAQLLATKVSNTPDSITFVPLHWRRQLTRGFNQSELLADELAKLLHVPIEYGLFTRLKATKQQQGLSQQQRRTNVHNAFQIHKSVQGRHIAIVDDVVTTGETINQLVKLLLMRGAKSVDVYCICRTSISDD